MVDADWNLCFLCSEVFTSTEEGNEPMVSSCGHSLCRSCFFAYKEAGKKDEYGELKPQHLWSRKANCYLNCTRITFKKVHSGHLVKVEKPIENAFQFDMPVINDSLERALKVLTPLQAAFSSENADNDAVDKMIESIRQANDSFHTCKGCQRPFSSNEYSEENRKNLHPCAPMVGLCGHTFCLDCLYGAYAKELLGKSPSLKKFPCPHPDCKIPTKAFHSAFFVVNQRFRDAIKYWEEIQLEREQQKHQDLSGILQKASSNEECMDSTVAHANISIKTGEDKIKNETETSLERSHFVRSIVKMEDGSSRLVKVEQELMTGSCPFWRFMPPQCAQETQSAPFNMMTIKLEDIGGDDDSVQILDSDNEDGQDSIEPSYWHLVRKIKQEEAKAQHEQLGRADERHQVLANTDDNVYIGANTEIAPNKIKTEEDEAKEESEHEGDATKKESENKEAINVVDFEDSGSDLDSVVEVIEVEGIQQALPNPAVGASMASAHTLRSLQQSHSNLTHNNQAAERANTAAGATLKENEQPGKLSGKLGDSRSKTKYPAAKPLTNPNNDNSGDVINLLDDSDDGDSYRKRPKKRPRVGPKRQRDAFYGDLSTMDIDKLRFLCYDEFRQPQLLWHVTRDDTNWVCIVNNQTVMSLLGKDRYNHMLKESTSAHFLTLQCGGEEGQEWLVNTTNNVERTLGSDFVEQVYRAEFLDKAWEEPFKRHKIEPWCRIFPCMIPAPARERPRSETFSGYKIPFPITNPIKDWKLVFAFASAVSFVKGVAAEAVEAVYRDGARKSSDNKQIETLGLLLRKHLPKYRTEIMYFDSQISLPSQHIQRIGRLAKDFPLIVEPKLGVCSHVSCYLVLFQDKIFEPSLSHALWLNKKNLDLCCGFSEHSGEFIGVRKVCKLST